MDSMEAPDTIYKLFMDSTWTIPGVYGIYQESSRRIPGVYQESSRRLHGLPGLYQDSRWSPPGSVGECNIQVSCCILHSPTGCMGVPIHSLRLPIHSHSPP